MYTIVIEGADRTGKCTQASLLASELRSRGFKVAEVEVPYKNGLTYRLIYRMLKTGSALKYKHMFQFVQFMNKLLFECMDFPNLKSAGNDYVVLDRWALSSVAYGRATGIDEGFVMPLFNQLFEPDCTIILHGPAYPKLGIDSYERNTKLQDDVRDIYKQWALDHPRKYQLVHVAGRSREEVANIIVNSLELRGIVNCVCIDRSAEKGVTGPIHTCDCGCTQTK